MAVDLLLFGAHPDDVEWGLGGSLLLLREKRATFVIVDMTNGEMGSRGTVEARRMEGAAAAQALGAVARESMGLPDCGLADLPENRQLVAKVIRRHRPRIVVAPYWEDRHPDHAAAGSLVRNSELYATLRKLEDESDPHRPEGFFYYLLNNTSTPPAMVIDTSTVFSQKLDLLRLHQSQFGKTADEFGVLALGIPDYLFGLESRDRFFGSLIGARYGEALVTDRPVRLAGLSSLVG